MSTLAASPHSQYWNSRCSARRPDQLHSRQHACMTQSRINHDCPFTDARLSCLHSIATRMGGESPAKPRQSAVDLLFRYAECSIRPSRYALCLLAPALVCDILLQSLEMDGRASVDSDCQHLHPREELTSFQSFQIASALSAARLELCASCCPNRERPLKRLSDQRAHDSAHCSSADRPGPA